MPRSGVNGTYTLPGAQNTQQPVTTIPSSVNNQGWSDVEQTFNTPQPLAYGGTGATTPVGAADALSTKGTDIASAGTTNLAAATGVFVHITGTTTITAFGSAAAGVERDLVFDGILTLTHNSTSLILPGGANIATAAGDTATAISEGSGNWRVVSYNRAIPFPATAYSPNVTASIGAIGSVSGSAGVYQKIGSFVYFKSSVTIVNAGTGAGFLRINLPFTPNGDFSAFGRETAATGLQLQGEIIASTAYVSVAFYNNNWPGATGNRIVIQGFFTTAS